MRNPLLKATVWLKFRRRGDAGLPDDLPLEMTRPSPLGHKLVVLDELYVRVDALLPHFV